MADEKVVEEKKSKPKSSMIMIIALIVLGIVLAGAISFFVAAKIAGDRPTTVVVKREPGVFLKIGDPKEGVIVNIGGVSGRYLKIVMTLEVEPTKLADGKTMGITPQDEIKINDTVIKFLRAQKIDAFLPDKQDELKAAIKKNINESMGGERVMDIFITNLVVQ